jgi:hypothetical protein
MNKTAKRNLIGGIVCFILSVLLGGIGITIMMVREGRQSQKYGFPIEEDDILRYSFIGACGYICNAALLIIGVNHLWFT